MANGAAGSMKAGRSTLVEFNLKESGGKVSGTLTLLSRTNQDIDSGMVMKIVKGDMVADSVNFVVAFDENDIDSDALVFEFIIAGDTLNGFGYENFREDDRIPLTFLRYK